MTEQELIDRVNSALDRIAATGWRHWADAARKQLGRRKVELRENPPEAIKWVETLESVARGRENGAL